MSSLLTAQETADALRISVDTVYRLTRSGRLPSVRYANSGPSRTLIPADAVEAFVAAHTRPRTA